MGYQLIINENVSLNVYEIRIIFSTLKFRTDQILHNTCNLAQVITVNQAGFAGVIKCYP